MKVLVLTEYGPDALPTGGVLRRDGFVQGLRDLGDSVTVEHVQPSTRLRDAVRRNLALRHARLADPEVLADLGGEAYDVVHVDGLPLAHAALGARRLGVPAVVDVCDSWESRLRTEARRANPLARADLGLSRAAVRWLVRRRLVHATGVVYIDEADAHADRCRGGLPPAYVVPNGVDDTLFALPVAEGTEPQAVFAGDWSYPPNLQGLRWFCSEVWPQVSSTGATVALYGPRPPATALPDGVRFHGFVADRADLYRHARVVLAPLLSGAGVKNKVLEGLAAGRPVLTTPLGATGAPDVPGLVVAPDESAFAVAFRQLWLAPSSAPDSLSRSREAVRARWSDRAAALREVYRADG